MKNLLITSALLLTVASPTYAQQIEKVELILAPPNINRDRGDGYQYEMRGNVLAKDQTKIGRYLLRVRYNKPDGLIATFAVTVLDKGTMVWESYSKYELDDFQVPLSFAYQGQIINGGKILTEYTPMFSNSFGGKLVVYFLND